VTEIEHVTQTNHLPTRPDPVAGLPALGAGVAALQQWAETAHAAASLIGQMVDTPFFPEALRPKLTGSSLEHREAQRAGAIANGTGAVLYGVEIGLNPMQALNNVIVIHGRPSLYAETMVALVQAAGHDIWTVESTETRAVVCGRRAGSDKVETAEFTMERARKAGYVARNKKYVEDPIAMLYARAASIACRRTAPEVLKGIPAFEEVQDFDRPRPSAPPAGGPPVTVAEITGSPTAEPIAEPDHDEPPPDEQPAPQPAEDRDALLVSLRAGMANLGVVDPMAQLRACATILDQPVRAARDMSDDQLHQVLDLVAGLADAGEAGRQQLAALAADQDPAKDTQ
jgi:hypothetical protein